MDDVAIDMYLFLGAAILCLIGTLICFFVSRHPRRWRKQYAYRLGLGYKQGDEGGKRRYDKRSKLLFSFFTGLFFLGFAVLGWLCWSAHLRASEENELDRVKRKAALGGEDRATGLPSSNLEKNLRGPLSP